MGDAFEIHNPIKILPELFSFNPNDKTFSKAATGEFSHEINFSDDDVLFCYVPSFEGES